MAATRTAPRPSAAVAPPAAPPPPVRARRGASRQLGRTLRDLATAAAVIAMALLAWEGYKALGQATGDLVPLTSLPLPVATDDAAMPHVWQVLAALAGPASTASDQTLLAYYLQQTSVTLREAAYGLALGAAVGVCLALLMRQLPWLGRASMPWLVVSQTIPLVALAPIVVVWIGGAGFPSWVAVTVISAYLAFFPVTLNTATGLLSADLTHVELMRSVAASPLQTLLLVRVPAAVPSFFTGLRLAATASVVGAVVGELSAGAGLGIGRAILTAAYYYSLAPANLYAAVLVASLAGVVFVQVIALAERLVLSKREH
ncbi:ABC transporter permease [Quadrisphaera sp. INWT6]|uniref:ABC transporter permease n=1 Tax=Quadrisphaera sp. INWT6 TaxID=2596917 RepID=UPI0018922A4D|nr:ABC transporter permease subunit [Quadrisphaera sp. INWT6]MBF5081157.1 ABC transporter permease subunit [Quadrisphaera sp. INWT6]